jgi:uncharacterized membrane protein
VTEDPKWTDLELPQRRRAFLRYSLVALLSSSLSGVALFLIVGQTFVWEVALATFLTGEYILFELMRNPTQDIGRFKLKVGIVTLAVFVPLIVLLIALMPST